MRSDEEEERRIRWRRGAWTGAMVACATSTGDYRREAMRRRIRPPLCAPCARIRLWRHGSGAVAGFAIRGSGAPFLPRGFCTGEDYRQEARQRRPSRR
uniref:Uncharacterized protein n=1 Tax=Oryza barthii TaxID=65489 RepID=A0A0D3HE06_9ORYZ